MNNKHKYYEMIVAKAANMDLVLFVRAQVSPGSYQWDLTDLADLCKNQNKKFFACLPQHKQACLHWLNGGDSQILNSPRHEWMTLESYEKDPAWHAYSDFMSSECQTRIKKKKVKRWVVIDENLNVLPKLWVDPEALETAMEKKSDHQFIEIEVEV